MGLGDDLRLGRVGRVVEVEVVNPARACSAFVSGCWRGMNARRISAFVEAGKLACGDERTG